MTQKNKELLLRDLCCRLPYGVKCENYNHVYGKNIFKVTDIRDNGCICGTINNKHGWAVFDPLELKPYLFPLSSMTEEQYESLRESGILSNCSHSYEYVNSHIHGVSFIFKEFKTYSLELIEWLNKNHFDYRGLIPLGLAKDATNLNIY